MSSVRTLRMPVQGENRDIFYDNYSLHFKSLHCARHSKDKDKSVYLSYEEKTFVKKAVKISPMQSARDLLRNLQDTDDAIDFSLKKSVQYHVRKERHGIRAYLLDDVEVDDTLGSLSRLSDKIWFKTALYNTMLAGVWTFSKFTASDGNS